MNIVLNFNEKRKKKNKENPFNTYSYIKKEYEILYSEETQAEYEYYLENYANLNDKEKEHLKFIQDSRETLDKKLKETSNLNNIPSKSNFKNKLCKYAPIGVGLISSLILISTLASKRKENYYGGGKSIDINNITGRNISIHS